MNSEIDIEAFRNRIGRLIGDREPFKWAKDIGIAGATFDRFWNGGSIPKLETLNRIVRAEGVSLDWLVYGDAEPTRLEQPKKLGLHKEPHIAAYVDARVGLIDQVAKRIADLYRAENARASALELVALAMEEARRIAEFTDLPEQWPAMVDIVIANMRDELRTPPTAERPSKHRA